YGGRLLRNRFGSTWPTTLLDDPDLLDTLGDVPPAEFWSIHQDRKELLARFTRGRLQRQAARYGASPDELRAIERVFDPEVLTLGFARRFATYKRATLMFRD